MVVLKEILLGETHCLGEENTAEEWTCCWEESAGVDVVSCCEMAMMFDHLTSHFNKVKSFGRKQCLWEGDAAGGKMCFEGGSCRGRH